MSLNRKKIAKKFCEDKELVKIFGKVDMFDIIPLKSGPRRDVARWSCKGWVCFETLSFSAKKNIKFILGEHSNTIYAVNR